MARTTEQILVDLAEAIEELDKEIAEKNKAIAERQAELQPLFRKRENLQDARKALGPKLALAPRQPIQIGNQIVVGPTPATARAFVGEIGIGIAPAPSASSVIIGPVQPPPKSLVEAARMVLIDAGKPLGVRELITRIQAKGVGQGKSFERMRANLIPTIHRRAIAGEGDFVWVSKGTYGLRFRDKEGKKKGRAAK